MKRSSDVDTVIYVDVDGVVNIGIADGDRLPLLLTMRDLRNAVRSLPKVEKVPQEQKDAILLLVAAAERSIGQGEDADDTYLKFCASEDGSSLSDILVGRLAGIIGVAQQSSGSVHVVLASKWRKPQQMHRRKRLEEKISDSLGKFFEFDSTTALTTELNAADRIDTIADHLASFCKSTPGIGQARKLQVLVLDDFFITALGRWECGGSKMNTSAKVESYLKSMADRPNVVVKLAHCYDEWEHRATGKLVQVGSGLTELHTKEAKSFLSPDFARHYSGSSGSDIFSGDDGDPLVKPERRGRLPTLVVNGFVRQRSEGDDDDVELRSCDDIPFGDLPKGKSVIVHL